MLKAEAARGYILEEVLAYLIQNNGYAIFSDESQDPESLVYGPNGLAVRGRGANHQVDVLGQLNWVPAFTYPFRLFVEAKFRKQRTGLAAVRNAVGVILDVNQGNLPRRESGPPGPPPRRYMYAYSLFSTSGFTRSAQDMAVAHQISLIDLSGDEYRSLRTAIRKVAKNLPHAREKGRWVSHIRYVLRSVFWRLDSEEAGFQLRGRDDQLLALLRQTLRPVIEAAKAQRELFIGMSEAPFIVVLKAKDATKFIAYCETNPWHRVVIRWKRDVKGASVWSVVPSGNPYRYRLEFRIPRILEDWIFYKGEHARARGLYTKEAYFSRISIYHKTERAFRLYTLEFDLKATLDAVKRRPSP